MSYQQSDTEALETELVALETFVNKCDDEIRKAQPVLQGIRSVINDVDFDGTSIADARRLELKTALITKSKEIRGATD